MTANFIHDLPHSPAVPQFVPPSLGWYFDHEFNVWKREIRGREFVLREINGVWRPLLRVTAKESGFLGRRRFVDLKAAKEWVDNNVGHFRNWEGVAWVKTKDAFLGVCDSKHLPEYCIDCILEPFRGGGTDGPRWKITFVLFNMDERMPIELFGVKTDELKVTLRTLFEGLVLPAKVREPLFKQYRQHGVMATRKAALALIAAKTVRAASQLKFEQSINQQNHQDN